MFLTDLRWAVDVWRHLPWLPLVSALTSGLLVPAAGVLPEDGQTLEGAAFGASLVLVLISVAVGVFWLGWLGVERFAYAQVRAGGPLGFREAVGYAWGYVGRFAVLGVVVGVPSFTLSAVLTAVTGSAAAGAAVSVVVYIGLTFVPPALVYDTERATVAIGTGLQTLRRSWPGSAPYALIPPLALGALSVVGGNLALEVTGAALAALIGLAFKGAIAAHYLRLREAAAPDEELLR